MTMSLGVVATSRKENEHRVPIHPRHLDRLDPAIRGRMIFEAGYGERFDIADAELISGGGSVASREELLGEADIVLLPKPLPADLGQVREGGVLWGWPHCVQGAELTRVAIERRLTLIAWEAMFGWSSNGAKGTHVFARNNELAGYCGVLHALELAGIDGHYGPQRRVVVLGFGSVSRGAIYALQGRGFSDITILTQRPPHLVKDRCWGCRHLQMRRGEHEMVAVDDSGRESPLRELLAQAEIIVNGTLQDTDDPLMFLLEGEENDLRSGTLIIDVSCDLAMGFPFARPTSFAEPWFQVAESRYYAVDHTPSYLWNAASWEISNALLPYLDTVLGGPEAWATDATVDRSIEIAGGVIRNPKILSFQKLEPAWPHHPVA